MFSSLTLLAGHVYNEEMQATCANTRTQPASQSGLPLVELLSARATAAVIGRGGGPGGVEGLPTVAGLLQFPAHHHAAQRRQRVCWWRYELVGDKAPPPPCLARQPTAVAGMEVVRVHNIDIGTAPSSRRCDATVLGRGPGESMPVPPPVRPSIHPSSDM